MSGSQDPNYERVLGLIRPLMQAPSLPHPPKSPRGSAKSAPNTKPADVELERIKVLELGLLRVVVTKWSYYSNYSQGGKLDVPIAALIDGSSDENVISHDFLVEIVEHLPHVHRITLTFRPASGGGTQSRHFTISHIPHPMILGAGGVYSQQGPERFIEQDTFSGKGSTLSPTEQEYLPMVFQNTDAQQVIPRLVPATSNQQPIVSPSGASNTFSVTAALTQGDPISSIQTIPKTTGSEILASSGGLARNVAAAAAESSSAWGPSNSIATGAAAVSVLAAGNSIYGTTVAHGARAQAVRSADIAQKNLDLSREVFEHTKKKDAAAAAATNAAAAVRSSKSDSDSDDADSGVGGSSSKSTSIRVSRSRATATPSAVSQGKAKEFSPSSAAAQGAKGEEDLSRISGLPSPPTLPPSHSSASTGRLKLHDSSFPVPRTPQELDTLLPPVPTHSFDVRPPSPEHKPLQSLDEPGIEMDELSGLRDNGVLADSAEGPHLGVHAYSDGSSITHPSCHPSAGDAQASKEERRDSITMHDNSITADALPSTPRLGEYAVVQTGSTSGVICEVGNDHGASDSSSLQQDSSSSLGEQKKVQESEHKLEPDDQVLVQQIEDQPSCISSPDTFEELGQGSESIPHISRQVTAEQQDDHGTPSYQAATGEVDARTTSCTGSESAESVEEQLVISVVQKDTSDHESAQRDEHEFEVEDSNVEENQNERTGAQENEVEEIEVQGHKVDDEQMKDIGAEADSKYGKEPRIKDEPKASSPGLHKAVGCVNTSGGNTGASTAAAVE